MIQLRSKQLIKNTGSNLLLRGALILLNFLFVPLSINILGPSDYGIWLTIFSVINYFSFFDFGLGHGLRNKLTIELTKRNYKNASIYISTSYISISIISILLIISYYFVFNSIQWELIFNIPTHRSNEFLALLQALVILFSVNLTLKLVESVNYANQKPQLNSLISFSSSLIAFLTIYILDKVEETSLFLYGIIILISQTIVYVVANIVVLKKKKDRPSLSPSIKAYNSNYRKNISSLGISFFIIQISAVILYSTDNIIINNVFGPEYVTIYNIPRKFYGLFSMILSILSVPFWSAITESIQMDDFQWIKKTTKKYMVFVIALSAIALGTIPFINHFYSFWIGNDFIVPFNLSVIMALFAISSMFLQIFTILLNGIGLLKKQLIVSVFCSLINIPLSIFLSKTLNLGISGVILATLICNLTTLCFLPNEYFKYLKGKLNPITEC